MRSICERSASAAILGGEFEARARASGRSSASRPTEQRSLATSGWPQPEPLISLDRLAFEVPDRSGFPPLREICSSDRSRRRLSRCRFDGSQPRLQTSLPPLPDRAGLQRRFSHRAARRGAARIFASKWPRARSTSRLAIPIFSTAPATLSPLVEALHREFPRLTYDVTIKIEHLLRNAEEHLPRLRDTGCLFVTSAVESVDDAVLAHLDKGHTRADFLAVVAQLPRRWA